MSHKSLQNDSVLNQKRPSLCNINQVKLFEQPKRADIAVIIICLFTLNTVPLWYY